MDAIQTTINDLLGPSGTVIVIGLFGVFLVLLTLPFVLKRPEDPFDRLKVNNRQPDKAAKKGEKLRVASNRDKLEKYATFLEPQNAAEFSAVKLKLMQAGYRSKNAVRIYNFLQFTLGIGGLLGGAAYALIALSQAPVLTHHLIMIIAIPGGIGYMFPKYWVTRRQEVRKQAITHAFPDALDLMLVCVEAGQSLDQSIVRVSSELQTGFPELAEEFSIVSQESKAGKEKSAVLKDMAERCGVPDISSFVTVMVQSAQFGTSISDALRVYAAEMRDKRVMRAEEAANKLPTKMTLATMMLTVPPLMAILIGPSIYAITQNLN
ncbi:MULTISPECIES: type II secretion system F family protein [unclassified Yoonia]|uniref:type II secretion system F family protein n=1 Tax=unclassified Yoonia TaxID=2629118 RepID=UPI002AFE2C56|nr:MULTISPECIES: type II secretion system F family protein [unclassified Yoonia]